MNVVWEKTRLFVECGKRGMCKHGGGMKKLRRR